MNKKLLLIDGLSILNRAYYGIPDLTCSSGLHTNGIYGFLSILFKIMEEENPDYLCVAFDTSAPTFRHEMYAAYKGTRKEMPHELREQIPVLKEVLDKMNIFRYERKGLEADDLLGTLAVLGEEEGMDVSLLSGDRDLLQIATDKIKIRIPKTKQGRTEIEDYYAEDVLQAYKVTPEQFIELKALMGDSSDNIPGVPKVGEKTATQLMVEFQSLDNIYFNLDNITKNAIRNSLSENKDLAYLSRDLAKIEKHAEIEFTLEDLAFDNIFNQEAFLIFKKLEFKNFFNKFEKEKITTDQDHKFVKLNFEALKEYLDNNKKATVAGIYFLNEEDGFPIHIGITGNDRISALIEIKEENDLKLFHELLKSDTERTFVFKDLKKYLYLINESDEKIEKNYFDLSIVCYLLNPLKNEYPLDDIANELLELPIPSETIMQLRKSGKNPKKYDPISWEEWETYICSGSRICYLAGGKTKELLTDKGMWNLYETVEMPLCQVLYHMEKKGIKVQKEELKEYADLLETSILRLEESIYQSTGEEFNLNSPKQLGVVLFEKLKIPGGKKTKTGYSTSADVLEKLKADYPLVAEILEYRTLTKLKSTYADALPGYIKEDGRIHTSLNQTITATGRISSTEPNLQNIPMRYELGRKIRKVFVPEPGNCFVDADYSQIELRIMAHLSQDEQLIQAYNSNADIHRMTASQVFHIPFEEVTDLERRNAKAVNFGIIYGISSFGLSQDLSISVKEASKYIEKYFETYPKVKEYLDRTVQVAKEEGVSKTFLGRIRPIPELKSSNFMQRSFGERVAMNAPIQGAAADIIKIAMINVYKTLLDKHLESRMILQIHDEILIEGPETEKEIVKELVEKEMQDAVKLAVPMIVEAHIGFNWYEAK